ncbi:cyclic GMP-AMP synthase [Elgaria multicarinata webbii]|uniref:cyclic GMP-AMP synthase n=1 Tax=Elgaria multicarinata webbii TaxID=159646 RepID=UPI002FCCD0D1
MERGAAGRGAKKTTAAQPVKKDAAAAAAAASAPKRRGGRQGDGETTARPTTAPRSAKSKATPKKEGKGSAQAGKDVVPGGRKNSQKKQVGIPKTAGAEQAKVKVESEEKPIVSQTKRGCAPKENGPTQVMAEVDARRKPASQKTKPLPREEKGTTCTGGKASQKTREGAPKGEEREQAEKRNGPKEKKPGSRAKQECALRAMESDQRGAAAAAPLPPPPPQPVFDEAVLKDVLRKIKLKKEKLITASQRVNKIRDILVTAIKKEPCFSSIEVMGTGSYYEHVKVCNPNEFDIMLKVPNLRIELEPCDAGAASGAFYYVKLKRNPGRGALDKFLDDKRQLSSSTMLSELRHIIMQEIGEMKDVTVERKRPGSPAVTFRIENPPSDISVDITLALECRQRNWCDSTNNGLDIKGWLGAKVKQAYLNEPLYLVPKHVKDGKCYKENTWRLSFSNIEKSMITNHGNTKTCCETNSQKCCRKDCLKLLKYLLEQLKTRHENRSHFEKFNSYHAKTSFFHACTKWPKDDEWPAAKLVECFVRLLDYFLDCLKKAELQHFFIPKFNFFCEEIIEKAKCKKLAEAIESEKQNSFPVFSL